MLRAFNVFRTLLIVIACSAQEQYSSNFFQALLLFLVSEIFALTRARTTFFKLFQPRLLFFCYWDICSLPAQEQYHLNFVFNPSSPVQLCLMNKNCFYNPLVCTKNNHNGYLAWSTFVFTNNCGFFLPQSINPIVQFGTLAEKKRETVGIFPEWGTPPPPSPPFGNVMFLREKK